MKIVRIISRAFVLGSLFSLPAFADKITPVQCKNSQMFPEVKEQILSLNQKVEWNSPNCSIIGTKSIFPKKDQSGKIKLEKGLQLFVYQNNQLQFICLPGWQCKAW